MRTRGLLHLLLAGGLGLVGVACAGPATSSPASDPSPGRVMSPPPSEVDTPVAADRADSGSRQSAVAYRVSFENAAHHEARIEVTFLDVPAGPLQLRMSRTSPGRYALHEFAKNVYDVTVTDGAGAPLAVTRPNPHQWDVTGHRGTVEVEYTLFGDRWDGTYAAIDRTGALLNAPATWMWARGMDRRPVTVEFQVPAGSSWEVATQLEPSSSGAPLMYGAPDQAYLMDSPVLLADFFLHEWQRESMGRTWDLRFALHSDSDSADIHRYMEWVEAVVDEEVAVFGEMPAFDYGVYTFLAVYLPWASGDGMEHRNSTVLTRAARLPDNALRVLGTVAHEFFHAWNVERIRPATLEPFDFESANMSRELWFAEGFTSYYDDLAIRRADIIDDVEFADRMASLINAVTHSPGRRWYSPIEMSMQAPFVDAAVSVDPVNRGNTFISYYTWGAALGLALDLELRSRFRDLSLDNYMRAIWEAHGKPFDPYDVDDLERILGTVTGDVGFAGDFFSRYIRGHEVPDYRALLAHAGFETEPADADRATLGPMSLSDADSGIVLTTGTLQGTPAYEAGLDRGDRLISVAGQPVRTRADYDRVLEGLQPGATVEVRYHSRGRDHTARVDVASDPTLRIVDSGPEDRTRSMDEFRSAWLGSKVR